MALDPIAAIRDILGSLRPAKTARLLTIDATGNTAVPGGTCKAIQCTQAGTITFKDAFGATVTSFPVTAGLNLITVNALIASSAGAVWGLYDKAP